MLGVVLVAVASLVYEPLARVRLEGPRRAAGPVASGASSGAARRVEVDLGRGKSVSVMLPLLEDDPDVKAVETMSTSDLVEQYGHLTGAGDIVWPAGLAFSRLLAHCPSFVSGQTVVELGAGLGAVGLTAAVAGATSVVLTDYDGDVLELAMQAAQENGVAARVSATRLDWASCCKRSLFLRCS